MGKKQNDAVVLSEQDQYTMLHNEIVQYGNMATTCFVQFMAKLKAMRDGKLYQAVGIESFGEYVEQQVGIKERQAYNYIATYETYSEEFLHSNAKIGITKLLLLAPLEEGEREQLMEEVDVENTTVKELKEEIAKRDEQLAERDQLIKERDKYIAEQDGELSELNQEFDDLQSDYRSLRDDYYAQGLKVNAIAKERDELERQKKDWQAFADEKQRMTEQLQKNEQEKAKLQQQIEELRNASAKVEVETVDNPETVKALEEAQKRIEELDAEKKKLEAEQKDLTKKLELANDETMLRFKSKFDDFQLIVEDLFELLAAMNDEKATKCKTALKAVVGGWQL